MLWLASTWLMTSRNLCSSDDTQLQPDATPPNRLNAAAPIFVPMTPPRSDCGDDEGKQRQDKELQWFADFEVPTVEVCRGEREGVLGQPLRRSWLQWSLDAGTPLNGTDPSDAKACRLDDGGGVCGYLFPDEDQGGSWAGTAGQRGTTDDTSLGCQAAVTK